MVTVAEFPPTGLPGDDVAVVKMPTAGKCKPDGSDVRVVTPGGTVTKHRVLMMGPGDAATIAFALKEGLQRYYLYFGNAGAKAAKDLEIQRGLLMETRRGPIGPIATFEQVMRAFDAADELVGRALRSRIFLGHNTFQSSNVVVSSFTGWLVCPAEGEYTFCTSSTDASFLLIDDRLVVSNGGRHRPQTDARMQANVRLTKGLHKLTMIHANARRQFIAVAAWRPPGGERIWPIPSSAFARVAGASAGAMESYGSAMTIDFAPVYAGESQAGGHFYQRYRFEAQTTGRAPRNMMWRWDFGDGMTSNRPRVDHVYLQPGDYKVTLSTRTYAGQLKRANIVHVSRPWNRLVNVKTDDIGENARIVADYDFSRLTPAQIMHVVEILTEAGMSEAVLKAGDAFMQRNKADPRSVSAVLKAYAEALVERGRPADAVRLLEDARDMSYSPVTGAELLSLAGRIAVKELNEDQTALRLFEQVVENFASMPRAKGVREAKIGIGDIWRTRGNFEKAMDAYRSAGPLSSGTPLSPALQRGNLARHAEDLLRREQLDLALEYVDTWERELPIDRLIGYSTLFRVLALKGMKQYRQAIWEAGALVKVNPSSVYSARLLMLAAESCKELGDEGKRAELLTRVVRDYPESPLAAKAAGQLKRM